MNELVMPESFRDRPYAREHFSRIARWALANHPFYQARVPGPRHEFPVLTRAMVQDGNAELLNGHACTGRTSGSTSMPVQVAWSKARAQLDARDNARFVSWMGGPLANMKIVSLAAHEANERTLDVSASMPDQVEFILSRWRAEHACSLITYPTNLEMLCRYVIEQRIDMSFLRRCTCMSEVYEPYHDELVRQAFPNAVATCTYSSVELGLIAIRCPHRPENYHLMAHKLGIEVLDAEGRPCAQGQVGQVVVTDYSNRQSSLLRYAVGDLAARTVCSCGKIPLPALTQLVGKVRGVLKDADGRAVMFTSLSPMFRDSPEIRQFQVIQPEATRFEVRYVARAGADLEPFHRRVLAAFAAQFGPAAAVVFVALADIPRSAGGKHHGAICLV